WGRRLADRLLVWTGGRRIPAALAVGVVYLALHECFALPLGIARLYHSRAWGMSNLDLPTWFRDRYLAIGVNVTWEAIVVAGFYALLILFPRAWWALAAIGGSLLG